MVIMNTLRLSIVFWTILCFAETESATSQEGITLFPSTVSIPKRRTFANNSALAPQEIMPRPPAPSLATQRKVTSIADTAWYFISCANSETTTNLSNSAFEDGKTFIYLKVKNSAGVFWPPLVWVDNELGKPLVTYHSSFPFLSLGTFNRNIKTIYINLAESCESNNDTLFSTLLRLIPVVLNRSALSSSLCNLHDMHASIFHLNTNGYALCCQLSELSNCDKLYSDETLKTVASQCLTFFAPLILFCLIPRMEEEVFHGEDGVYIGLTEVTPLQLTHPVQFLILGLHRCPRVVKKVVAVTLLGVASVFRFMLPAIVPAIDTLVAVGVLLSSVVLMLVPVCLIQSAMQDGSRQKVCYGSFLDLPTQIRLKGRRNLANMLLHRMSFVFKRVFWKHWFTKRREWRYNRCLQCVVFIWLIFLSLTPIIGTCAMFLNCMYVFKPLDHTRLKSTVVLLLYVSLLLGIVYCWSVVVFTISCTVYRCLEYTIKGLVKNHSYIFLDLLFALFMTQFVLNVFSKVNNQYISYKKIIFEEAERIKDVYRNVWVVKDGMPFIPKQLYNHVINTVFPVTVNELKVLCKIALGVLFFVIVRKSVEDFHIKWSAFGEGIVSAATFAIPGMLEYYNVGDFTTEYRLKHLVECAVKEWLDQRGSCLYSKEVESQDEIQSANDTNAGKRSREDTNCSAANVETRSHHLVRDETQGVRDTIDLEGGCGHMENTVEKQTCANNGMERGMQRFYSTPATTRSSSLGELTVPGMTSQDMSHGKFEYGIGDYSNGNPVHSLGSHETLHICVDMNAQPQANCNEASDKNNVEENCTVSVDVHSPPSGYSWTHIDERCESPSVAICDECV